MSFERVRRTKNTAYTTIDNTVIRDKTLSLKAKALLLTVMGLPDTWDFSISGIVACVKEGKDAIYATIKELREAGYVEMKQNRDDQGKIRDWVYVFHERPVNREAYPLTGFPDVANPDMAYPDMENPPQYKKHLNNSLINQETPHRRRTGIPINPSADLELNTWLGAVAVAVGAKDRRTMPKARAWEKVCMAAIREQRDLAKMLTIIEAEKTRTQGQEEFFSPDTVLQKLQLNGSKPKPAKWAHDL
jgi:hypothetical protein